MCMCTCMCMCVRMCVHVYVHVRMCVSCQWISIDYTSNHSPVKIDGIWLYYPMFSLTSPSLVSSFIQLVTKASGPVTVTLWTKLPARYPPNGNRWAASWD